MIDRREVMELAREFGLGANVIEKDYTLGWMLAGIAAHPDFGSSWVFKGGTCLKKCYFETYRFSEDLDFTLTEPEHLDERFLMERFGQVAAWVYDNTGIEIPAETIRFEVYQNPRSNASAQGRVGYRGPMRRAGDAPRIKLDLTDDEVLVLDPTMREVHHPYSDRPADGIQVQCYGFEEVFAEKVRALAERKRPRDLYDVIHLFRHDELRPDRQAVFTTLERKCQFKGIPVPTMAAIENGPGRIELESEWETMLGHQLPALPQFAQFWEDLPAVFEWLHGRSEKVVRPSLQLATANLDDTWRAPAMSHVWGMAAPLEIIRFAAANRLCVDLQYQGSHRIIEPYSLRRTRDDHLLLYAVKHDTGESRSYRVDRIQGASVTRTSFVARYLVELTPVGPISAPPTSRSGSLSGSFAGGRPSATLHTATRSRAGVGPKYVFECPVCGKRFTRGSYSASLNSHKDKNGYPCPGRNGIFLETKY